MRVESASLRFRRLIAGGALIATLVACTETATPDDMSLLIYTTVTQDTVDAVVTGFQSANPEVTVEVFRAPTAEVEARIASELRGDGLQADLIWYTDPLSIQQHERAGLLLKWRPQKAAEIPDAYVTDAFVGTRILNLVIAAQPEAEVTDWADLPTLDGTVAVPDPGFAGSALAALGFFATSEDYGFDFLRQLAANGAVQVQSPGDVVNGVAEGLYLAGITLDRLARDAVSGGSPLKLVWPASGAIALYSPIAVVEGTASEGLARAFVEYTLGVEAQEAIAATGWQPIRDDVAWEQETRSVSFDWAMVFDRQDELLGEYRRIFGG